MNNYLILQMPTLEQCFTVELFIVQFHPVSALGKFVNFGLDTLVSERVNVMNQFFLQHQQGGCEI